MKKYILSLFALLAFLMPMVGLSANGLTDPGTVDGEKQSPLYRLFYKEHRISSNDSIAYVDSDGTEYSFSDIFDDMTLDYHTINDVRSTFKETDLIHTAENGTDDIHYVDFEYNLSVDDEVYIIASVDNVNNAYSSITGQEMSGVEENYNSPYEKVDTFTVTDDTNPRVRHSLRNTEDEVEYTAEGSETVEFNYLAVINHDEFKTAPSDSKMDTYFDVYQTVEEGETYYYYTFDGGFISILWVAVLFSGSYLYIRKAEVEDTKQAIIQASIFFIIGLVLLRVIQTII